ncbi:hypothetical protein [Pseudomonas sp. NPDC086278]|uniref:hypothetical protein n=1 Tax=Pseudomonas sp. NPDC086278 TaxID=3390646 RepID=UPI003D0252C8
MGALLIDVLGEFELSVDGLCGFISGIRGAIESSLGNLFSGVAQPCLGKECHWQQLFGQDGGDVNYFEVGLYVNVS